MVPIPAPASFRGRLLSGLLGVVLLLALIILPLLPFPPVQIELDGSTPEPLSPKGNARLNGTVQDADGNPIEGATVRLTNVVAADSEKVKASPVTQTDASGSFRFESFPVAGSFSLEVRHPDFQPRRKTFLHGAERHRTGGGTGSLAVESVTITLREPAVLEGRVESEANGPVSGAKVLLLIQKKQVRFRDRWEDDDPTTGYLTGSPLWWEVSAKKKTGPDGRFRFEHLEVGAVCRIRVGGEGLSQVTTDPVKLTQSKKHRSLRIAVEKPGAIRGRVERLDGDPVESFQVYVVDRSSPDKQRLRRFSDAKGTFTLAAPGEGPCYVRVSASDDYGAARRDRAIPGEDPVTYSLEVRAVSVRFDFTNPGLAEDRFKKLPKGRKPSRSIHSFVWKRSSEGGFSFVGSGGGDVRNYSNRSKVQKGRGTRSLMPASTQMSGLQTEGSVSYFVFMLPGAHARNQKYHLGLFGFRQLSLNKKSDPNQTVPMTYREGAVVTGRLVERRTGEPVSDAVVQVTDWRPAEDRGGRLRDWFGKDRSSEDGSFRVSGIPYGSELENFALRVSVKGYAAEESRQRGGLADVREKFKYLPDPDEEIPAPPAFTPPKQKKEVNLEAIKVRKK